MNWLNKLERKIGRYAVPNLIIWLIGAYTIGYVFGTVSPGILSISDIQGILNPITEKYFGNDENYSLEDIYKEVFSLEHPETQNLMKDLAKKFNTSMNTFPDASEDEADLLHTFSFICMLSYDVYIKKTLIEKMIDQMASKNPETKPSKK